MWVSSMHAHVVKLGPCARSSMHTCACDLLPRPCRAPRPCRTPFHLLTPCRLCTAQGANPSDDQRSCVRCDTTSGRFYNFTTQGFSVNQLWVAGRNISGSSCQCPTGNVTVFAGETPVSSASIVTTRVQENGTLFQRCIVCPEGTVREGNGCQAPDSLPSQGYSTPFNDFTRANGLIRLGLNWVSSITVGHAGHAIRWVGSGWYWIE